MINCLKIDTMRIMFLRKKLYRICFFMNINICTLSNPISDIPESELFVYHP